MTLTVLVGGGRDKALVRKALAPFIAAVGSGEVACVVADEGDGVDLDRWRGVLADTASVRPVVVKDGRLLTAEDLEGVAGVFVAGGLTPLYAELVVPAREAMADLPYAGFSAGSAIAADRAIVGGWRLDDLEVCSEDASEDLDQVTVVDGLDRVSFAVDVHAAQWGTASRAIHAVKAGLVGEAWAVDEHTALVVADGQVPEVIGAGGALRITLAGDGAVTVRPLPPVI